MAGLELSKALEKTRAELVKVKEERDALRKRALQVDHELSEFMLEMLRAMEKIRGL